ncbi:MAG: membrane protein insertase YidC, partial [Pseudomonadota bacterium]
MNQEDQRNFLIAMVLMVGLIFASQFLFNEPASRDFEDRQVAASAPTEDAGTQAAPEETAASNQPSVDTSAETAEIVSPPPQPLNVTNSDRIPFDADAVDGSIRLVGARIDDLKLKRHFKTPKRQEELVLLRPQAERNGYYATYLWRDAKERPIAGVDTVWTKISGSELGVDRPVTLRFEGGGLRIDRTISVDQDYMFTFSDAVTNIGPSEKTISTLGVIRRYGEWKEFLAATDPGVGAQSGIGFKGLIGVLDNSLNLRNYSKLDKGQGFKGETRAERTSGDGGWVGLTDKYFMTVLAPDQSTPFAGAFYRRQSEGR